MDRVNPLLKHRLDINFDFSVVYFISDYPYN